MRWSWFYLKISTPLPNTMVTTGKWRGGGGGWGWPSPWIRRCRSWGLPWRRTAGHYRCCRPGVCHLLGEKAIRGLTAAGQGSRDCASREAGWDWHLQMKNVNRWVIPLWRGRTFILNGVVAVSWQLRVSTWQLRVVHYVAFTEPVLDLLVRDNLPMGASRRPYTL